MKLKAFVLVSLLLFSFISNAHAVSGLHIKCDQEGTEIFLNDKSFGQCPKNVIVPAGNYRVVLKKSLEDKSYWYYETQMKLAENAVEKLEVKLERTYPESYYYQKAMGGNTVADLQEYLQENPGGQHAEELRQRLNALEDEAYGKAKSGNDGKAYQEYLSTFPNGRYVMEIGELAGKSLAGTIDMVLVKGGCFHMGDSSGDGEKDEKPVHEVCVSNFFIGKYDVTVKQFRQFVQATGYKTDAERSTGGEKGCYSYDQDDKDKLWDFRAWADWKKPNRYQGNEDSHPVSCVSWNDAKAFVDWLNKISGKKYRLPTEAEWEYAARGGTSGRNYWGDGKNDACRYANVADQTPLPNGWSFNNRHECKDGYAFVSPVGKFQPNAYGLYDMMGNVWQWIEDWYDENYYSSSPKDNPQGPARGEYRVRRGGSWNYDPQYVRASIRLRIVPYFRSFYLGFRVARTN